jgi:hypothetical protein
MAKITAPVYKIGKTLSVFASCHLASAGNGKSDKRQSSFALTTLKH